MRLHRPAFERALRSGVRAAVRASDRLRRAVPRGRPRSRGARTRWPFRIMGSLLLGCGVAAVVGNTRSLDLGLLVIHAWLLVLTLIAAKQLVRLPYGSHDVAALRLLPTSEETIFRWEFFKFVRGYAFLLGDLAVALVMLLLFVPMPWLLRLLVVPVIALTWMFSLALAAFLAARLPRLPYGSIVGLASWVVIGLFFGHKIIGHAVLLRFFETSAPVANLFVPTGWVIALYGLALGHEPWPAVLLFLPIAGLLWQYRSSRGVLASRFVYREWVRPETPDVIPKVQTSESKEPETGEPFPDARRGPARLGPAAIEEGLLSGALFAQPTTKVGWVENRLWRWFSAREKSIAEFAFASTYPSGRPWLRQYRMAAVVVALAWLGSWVHPGVALGILLFGLALPCLAAFSMFSSSGRAFRSIRIGGIGVPLHAAYPLSFHELARVLMKYSAIQLPLLALFVVPVFALALMIFHIAAAAGAIVGLNVVVVLWGARLLLILLAFQHGTACRWPIRILQTGAVVMGGLLYLSTLAIVLVVALLATALQPAGNEILSSPVPWIFPLLSVLLAWLDLSLYRWFYHTARLDLMHVPP